MSCALYDTVAGFRAACDAIRARGERLGLVPTMGALHQGHMALIAEAKRRAECVAVTIFVNPTQFGPNEDFEKYPRTLEEDREKCEQAGASLVFAPSVGEMYPEHECTRVQVSGLTASMCGKSRPGHFDGVTTIVTKLFSVAGPCVAVFGRKDYQQWKVIERMCQDLLLPVQIVAHATVREADGLAMSSRNAYLSTDERRRALALPRALNRAAERFASGERSASALTSQVEASLIASGFRIDYVSLADAEDLSVPVGDRWTSATAVLAVAAYMGKTRLIDNLVLGQQAGPDAEPVESPA